MTHEFNPSMFGEEFAKSFTEAKDLADSIVLTSEQKRIADSQGGLEVIVGFIKNVSHPDWSNEKIKEFVLNKILVPIEITVKDNA